MFVKIDIQKIIAVSRKLTKISLNTVSRTYARTIDLTLPTPLPSANDYNLKGVDERAEHTATRLNSKTRQPTPLTAQTLTLYLHVCVASTWVV